MVRLELEKKGLSLMLIEQEKEFIYTHSPFIYHDAMELKILNQKVTCTFDEIQNFIVKKQLTRIDLIIMDALYQFKFLNRHCLELYINTNMEIPSNIKKNEYKKNVKKLVKQGILLRQQFSWNNTSSSGSSPYTYSLSKGAFSYVKKYRIKNNLFIKNNSEFSIPEPVEILRRLIFNQFHIRFLHDYEPKIIQSTYFHEVNIKKYHFILDGCFRIKSKRMSKGFFDLSIIPLRRNPEWQKEFVMKLSLIYEYSSKHPHILTQPIMIVVCEDDLQVKEAFLCKELNDTTRNIMALYTTDIKIIREDVLEYLYDCFMIKDDMSRLYSNDFSIESPLSEHKETITDNFIKNINNIDFEVKHLILD